MNLDIYIIVFTKIKKYLAYIVDKTLKEKIETPITEEILDSQQNSNNTLDSNVTPHITLPYTGRGSKHGFKRFLSSTLPQNIKTRFTYRGKRLGSFFPIKDRTKWEHELNLVYQYNCNFSTNVVCNSESDYVGETNVRIGTRSHEHASTDVNSAISKHIITR